MIRYVLKRAMWVIPVMLGVLVIVFTLSYFTPGDPVTSLLGTNFTPEAYDRLSHEMGLDRPYLEQLWSYFWNLITKFDLGKSFSTNIAVRDEIAKRFPITLRLGLTSVCFTLILGLPLGIISAIKHYSILDTVLTSIALILAAVPGFVLALINIIVFGLKLKILPFTGLHSIKNYILPIASNALAGVAVIIRMTRATMLEVIRQDYIRTARAKGQKEGIIISRHALKNCLIPIVTSISGQIAMVMSGSIIVETLFAIPGMGTYMRAGLESRDYMVINANVLLISLVVCTINLLVDIVYAFIDPRIKAQYTSSKKKEKAVKKILSDSAEVA